MRSQTLHSILPVRLKSGARLDFEQRSSRAQLLTHQLTWAFERELSQHSQALPYIRDAAFNFGMMQMVPGRRWKLHLACDRSMSRLASSSTLRACSCSILICLRMT